MDRVAEARLEKSEYLISLFNSKGINFNASFDLFFRAFKIEKELEIWGKDNEGDRFVLLKKYTVCAASGGLGPKRKEGDRQVPEGVYHVNRFNPKSKFHLSLGLNYPNEADLYFSDKEQPGSDIFIHGSCVSIGCLAMNDERIKEIYLMAAQAKKYGQEKIPVHIFPMKMKGPKWEKKCNEMPELISFWRNLKTVFDFFEKEKQLPKVRVGAGGAYKVN